VRGSLFPLLIGATVDLAFGVWPAVVYVAVGYLWWALVAFGKRRRPDWIKQHKGGSFLTCLYTGCITAWAMFAIVAFCVHRAHHGWSLPESLGFSLLAGGLVAMVTRASLPSTRRRSRGRHTVNASTDQAD